MGVWRVRVEGRLACVIVSLRPVLVLASLRWVHPSGWPLGARRVTSVCLLPLFHQSGEGSIKGTEEGHSGLPRHRRMDERVEHGVA